MPFKARLSEAGVHLFDRESGLNLLLDEVAVPYNKVALAPRYVSIALTNACGLNCAYCYAPKYPAALDASRVLSWAVELDEAGCLGVGFGGGEPTEYPEFAEVCRQVTEDTSMAVTFTTHGHRVTPHLADDLRGSVHFARLSVDGVGATYERLRGRPFSAVRDAASLLRSLASIGINAVINSDTIDQLDQLAEFAADVDASELLLLPEQPTAATHGISEIDAERLVRWILDGKHDVRLALARSGLETSVPAAEPVPNEHRLDAHMHVDAVGNLRPNAFSSMGVPVDGTMMEAIHTLRETT